MKWKKRHLNLNMSWIKSIGIYVYIYIYLLSPHESIEYLGRCFLFPVCLNKSRLSFFYSNHLTYRILPHAAQLYLVLVERFPTHWRLSVQSLLLQNLILPPRIKWRDFWSDPQIFLWRKLRLTWYLQFRWVRYIYINNRTCPCTQIFEVGILRFSTLRYS